MDPRLVRAKDLYEQGMSLRDIGRSLDPPSSPETIRRWASIGGWERPTNLPESQRPRPVPSQVEVESAANRAELARQQAREKWANRRSEEADGAGRVATMLRLKVTQLLALTDSNGEAIAGKETVHAQWLRALTAAYTGFVEAANNLAGDGWGLPAQPAAPVTGPTWRDPEELVRAGRERALTLVSGGD